MQLRIYYDGLCPLCSKEIEMLKQLNTAGQLEFADLAQQDFIQRYPHIDPIRAYQVLHGETSDGTVITGLDVTCRAWQLVGKHRWLAVLRWPLIKPVADLFYRFFARHRQAISRLSEKLFPAALTASRCDESCRSSQLES